MQHNSLIKPESSRFYIREKIKLKLKIMANICITTYKVTGSRKAVSDLWDTFQELGVNDKDVCLSQLAEHYGIDYKNRGIYVRGSINWAEFDYDKETDTCLLSFDTETAWSACDTLFDEVNNVLGGELSISYREIECGCDVFHVHDEGNFFPEECCVTSLGEPFCDVCEEPYDTIAEAVEEWCSKTGIPRDGRNDEEMVKFINSYVYEAEHTYFSIYPFTFD